MENNMTTIFTQDLESVRDYYSRPRVVDGTSKTIYEIWESGDALGDSITPSTFCPDYQSHVTLKLQSLTTEGSTVFSVGCGNAVIEARLVQAGRRVRAIDYNREAVVLARNKGVDAFQADVMSLQPNTLTDVSLVYADGLVGHLFDAELGLIPFLEKLATLGLPSGARLFISNDAPRDSVLSYEPHDRVEGFWFVSPSYLANALDQAGFKTIECYPFPYLRPKSGLRNRTLCVAKV